MTDSGEPVSYRCLVHVVEVRNVKGRDSSGQSDPNVRVSVLDQQQRTATYFKTTSCTFDHLMFFEIDDVEPRELKTGEILFEVFDANTVMRDQLIGAFALDIAYVLQQPKKQLFRQWVALMDSTDKFEGIQGYLLVSIALVAPGESHTFMEEEEALERRRLEARGVSADDDEDGDEDGDGKASRAKDAAVAKGKSAKNRAKLGLGKLARKMHAKGTGSGDGAGSGRKGSLASAIIPEAPIMHAELQSMILMPPKLKTQDYEIHFTFLRAEHLPVMDSKIKGGLCDPYVAIRFGTGHRVTAQTSVQKNTLSPTWNEQVNVPVTLPTMADVITVSLMDKDVGSLKDDVISHRYFSFKALFDAQTKKPKKSKKGKGSVAGAAADDDADAGRPFGAAGGDIQWVNFYRESTGEYAGRVLFGIRIQKVEEAKLAVIPTPIRESTPLKDVAVDRLANAASSTSTSTSTSGKNEPNPALFLNSEGGVRTVGGEQKLFGLQVDVLEARDLLSAATEDDDDTATVVSSPLTFAKKKMSFLSSAKVYAKVKHGWREYEEQWPTSSPEKVENGYVEWYQAVNTVKNAWPVVPVGTTTTTVVTTTTTTTDTNADKVADLKSAETKKHKETGVAFEVSVDEVPDVFIELFAARKLPGLKLGRSDKFLGRVRVPFSADLVRAGTGAIPPHKQYLYSRWYDVDTGGAILCNVSLVPLTDSAEIAVETTAALQQDGTKTSSVDKDAAMKKATVTVPNKKNGDDDGDDGGGGGGEEKKKRKTDKGKSDEEKEGKAKEGGDEETRPAPMKPARSRYRLKAHLFQGKHLIAGDSTGTSDPFVRVQCGYRRATSKTIEKSTNPCWYETVTLTDIWVEDPKPPPEEEDDEGVELLTNAEKAAAVAGGSCVVVHVFDRDLYTSNDHLGYVVVPLYTAARTHHSPAAGKKEENDKSKAATMPTAHEPAENKWNKYEWITMANGKVVPKPRWYSLKGGNEQHVGDKKRNKLKHVEALSNHGKILASFELDIFREGDPLSDDIEATSEQEDNNNEEEEEEEEAGMTAEDKLWNQWAKHPRSCVPCTEPIVVEVSVLALRHLLPFRFFPCAHPFVVIDTGIRPNSKPTFIPISPEDDDENDGKRRVITMKQLGTVGATKAEWNVTESDVLQVVLVKLHLPVEKCGQRSLFEPTLNVRVYDKRSTLLLGGLFAGGKKGEEAPGGRVLVGTCAILLSEILGHAKLGLGMAQVKTTSTRLGSSKPKKKAVNRKKAHAAGVESASEMSDSEDEENGGEGGRGLEEGKTAAAPGNNDGLLAGKLDQLKRHRLSPITVHAKKPSSRSRSTHDDEEEDDDDEKAKASDSEEESEEEEEEEERKVLDMSWEEYVEKQHEKKKKKSATEEEEEEEGRIDGIVSSGDIFPATELDIYRTTNHGASRLTVGVLSCRVRLIPPSHFDNTNLQTRNYHIPRLRDEFQATPLTVRVYIETCLECIVPAGAGVKGGGEILIIARPEHCKYKQVPKLGGGSAKGVNGLVKEGVVGVLESHPFAKNPIDAAKAVESATKVKTAKTNASKSSGGTGKGKAKIMKKIQVYGMVEVKQGITSRDRLEIAVYCPKPNALHTGTTYDHIGSTIITLQDRYLSPLWQRMRHGNKDDKEGEEKKKALVRGGKKVPWEMRALWHTSSRYAQGNMKCCIDVLHAKHEAPLVKPWRLTPPTPKEFEIRVVVWGTRNVAWRDKKMSDVFVLAELEQHPSCAAQTTDTHWRCEDGKASFNWRFVFPVVLPLRRSPERLRIQLWDKDALNSNDAICEALLDIRTLFRKAYRQETGKRGGKGEVQLDRQWITLTHPNYEGEQGSIEVEMEILPMSVARKKPAGRGREEPNQHPHLPAPDRPETSFAFWRLDKVWTQILWKKYKIYVFGAAFCCVLLIVLVILMQLKVFF